MVEREYNVPLRKEYLKVPQFKRAKKAMTALRSFMVRHMKSEDVKIGKDVNEHIWSSGMKNPPHHVKVRAIKDKEGVVTVDLANKTIKKADVIREQKKAELDKKLKAEQKKQADAEKKEKAAEDAAAKKEAESAQKEAAAPTPAKENAVSDAPVKEDSATTPEQDPPKEPDAKKN